MSHRITAQDIINKKKNARRIVALTAYDYPFAQMVDEAGIDLILVGDSLGMVLMGEETTREVTMEQMIAHSKAVMKAVNRALVVTDMPYLSYESDDQTVNNAKMLLNVTGVQAVKLEGAEEKTLSATRALKENGIEVMGHIGLTPQSVTHPSQYRVKGKSAEEAKQLKQDAKALERAGVFAIVLECVPQDLAEEITRDLSVPTIGIGAGPHCDGQVLVLYDILGVYDRIKPKFARPYAPIRDQVLEGLRKYKEDVMSGKFPSDKESFT